MRQGRELGDDDLAVIHYLTHAHTPAWTRTRIAELLDCHRATVSRLLNEHADRCEAAFDDAEGAGRLDRLLTRAGVIDQPGDEPPELRIAQSIDDDELFGEALALLTETGWQPLPALVLVGVPRLEAAQWIKRAQADDADPEDAARWHLIEQARLQAMLRMWRSMGEGNPGWQAVRAQIQDAFGDWLAPEADESTRDPLSGVPLAQLRAIVYGSK